MQAIESILQSIKEFWQADVFRPVFNVIHPVFDKLFYFFLSILVFISALYLFMTIYSFFVKKRREKRVNDKHAPTVTVQIPTYNELAALNCAGKCLDFDYPKQKYEIIIGDDSNQPEISAEIDAFASKHPNVKVTRRGDNKGFKPGNLNHMLKYSKGDIIVIFDSDFLPPKDFLRRIVAPFVRDPRVAGVQARWNFTNARQNLVTALGAATVSVLHYIVLPFMTDLKASSFLCGSAEAVRKDLLVKLKGWKHGCMAEDIEFSLRLIKNGYRIEYLDGLECPGEVPYTPRDYYRQQMRWAHGVIYSVKRHAKDLFASKKLGVRDKLLTHLICSGYLLSVLLVLLFFTGTVSMITHAPGPVNIVRFSFDVGRNVLLTSGLIIASIIAIKRNNNFRNLWRVIAASFSYGIIVILYVNLGILKVFLNKPMDWYMLNKSGNKVAVST
jgi:cellulose synthase/poly-beta-1,6-N-acetylglucosamine synthase-like glycosyltransferase